MSADVSQNQSNHGRLVDNTKITNDLKKNNLKKKYDFSKGVRGKFYNPDGEFNLPIYLETEIAEFVKKLAAEKNLDQSQIVNLLLKKDKEIIEI